MNQVIPFDTATKLPAHLMAAGAAGLSLNDAAEEFASVKFPVISIKGSRFHVSRDGEKTLIMRPKTAATDPDEPATYIDTVILNIQKAKTFYAEGYVEGSDGKPDCFSNDGITPDASVEAKQCSTCSLCPKNAWGSGTNDKGEATKGKACSDVQRLAVNINDPMMLRVPPASLKNLAEMSKQLSKKGVPLNGVVTRISFDPTASSPVMVFKPVGYVSADDFAKAQALMNDDLVLAIVGKKNRGLEALGDVPAHVTKAAESAKVEAVKPAEPVTQHDPKAEAKAKKLAAAKAALAAAEAEDADPVPSQQPTATTVVSSGSIDEELAALIG